MAAVVHLAVPSISWPIAFALGAIVAPPDAIAAMAVLQRVGAPKRIDALQSRYAHQVSHSQEHHDRPSGEPEEELIAHRRIRRELIQAERESALDLHARGAISDEVRRRIERDLDLEELRAEG